MTRTLRFVSFSLAGLALLTTASACKVTTEDGNKITLTPLTRYNGTPETETAAWASGQAISIFNDNGQIVVHSDAAANEVRVVGKPFAFDDNKEGAQKTIENKLNLVLNEEDGGLVAAATMAGSGSYGYDLEVHLPAAFDGWLDVQQQNGSVELKGVGQSQGTRVNSNNGSIKATTVTLTNKIELTTRLGDIDANILPTGTDKSLVRSDFGDLDIGIPSGANLTIHAFSEGDGVVTYPESWAANGEENNVSITLGNGSTELEISSGKGDVALR